MQYSDLNASQIENILEQYSIFGTFSFSVLGGGSENTNYVISTDTAKYVLTISEHKTVEHAHNLGRLLNHLEKHRFKTSKIFTNTQNKAVTMFNEKPVILKQFIEGKIMADLPFHVLEQLGQQAGQLHKIKSPEFLPGIVWAGQERFDEVAEYAQESEFYDWLMSTRNYFMPYLTPDLPMALIHSDIFDSNVIVSHDEQTATIMDFEEAAYYYRVFDIAMMIIGLCREGDGINFNKVRRILKGYRKEIQLLDLEQTALQPMTVYAAAGVAFWRHKQFIYLYPESDLQDHYLEMKNAADYIRDLPPARFMQAFNKTQ